jgi:hypothetical protein
MKPEPQVFFFTPYNWVTRLHGILTHSYGVDKATPSAQGLVKILLTVLMSQDTSVSEGNCLVQEQNNITTAYLNRP